MRRGAHFGNQGITTGHPHYIPLENIKWSDDLLKVHDIRLGEVCGRHFVPLLDQKVYYGSISLLVLPTTGNRTGKVNIHAGNYTNPGEKH